MSKVDRLMTEENLIRIQYWVRSGCTDKEICEKLEISPGTFLKAKRLWPELHEVLKMGKEIVDTKVENALYKRAMGYEYDEVTEEFENGFMVKKKIVRKHVPPDTTAQIWWLKNRRSGEWRDRREVDNTIALEKLDEVLGQIKGCE